MKLKLALASLSLVAVSFTACGEDSKPVEETAVVKTETPAKAVETLETPKVEVPVVKEEAPKVKAPAPVETASATPDAAQLFNKCAGCHGVNAEKSALGKSKIIAELSATEIETAIKGYQDGTYGGPMKGLMKGQVATLTDVEIKALSEFIANK